MGIFRFLKKRKEKKQLEEVAQRYESEILPEEQKTNHESVRRYILEQCETMTEVATDLINARTEYESVTNYLTDIQTIEGMDEQDKHKLMVTADNILHLSQAKDQMQKKMNRLPDSEFNQMEQLKNDIPKAIVRLKENENSQAILKKDLDYLEGEKVEWSYEKTAIKQEQKILKKCSIVMMSLEALLLLIMIMVIYLDDNEISSAVLVAILVVAAIESLVMLRIQNNKMQMKQCVVNFNKAVSIQNAVKFKYVNMTNAVEYAHDIYHVKTAKELEVKWQLYLEALKEREKLCQANDDLNYYQSVLVRLLRMYHLFDAGIWPYQAEALVNPKEMVEVKHALLERRQKIRNRIESSINTIQDKRKQVELLCSQKEMMTPQIRGILDSLDKILNK